jgi:hypothetical protein
MKRYLFTLPVLLILILPGLISCGSSLSPTPNAEAKAAIIDQLYLFQPNQAFTDKTTELLEGYGFNVDVWQGEDITVDFYRQLPKCGYEIIVFRAHMGILCHVEESKVVTLEITDLFTGEAYTPTKYVTEQLNERIQEAQMPEDCPSVFSINPEFVTESMKGRFDDTAIIMMGCSGHHLDDMAAAFVQKGASAYLGWSASVLLDYVDTATLNLIDNLCVKNLTVEQAVARTMAEVGRDPYYNTRLKYYPAQSGSHTIRELIK